MKTTKKLLALSLIFGVFLAGCASPPPVAHVPSVAPQASISPSVEMQNSRQERKRELRHRYPSPKYVRAWSCDGGDSGGFAESQKVALQELVTQLGVNVTSQYSSTTDRQNMTVSRSTHSQVGIQGMEQIRGLIVKHVDPYCVFLAVNPAHTKDLYEIAITSESHEIGKLFTTLDSPMDSSLVKFRAATKLIGLLNQLKEDHAGWYLLTGERKVSRVSDDHMRELRRAVSFQVTAKEQHERVNPVMPNRVAERDAKRILRSEGFRVVDDYIKPAFILTIKILKLMEYGTLGWDVHTRLKIQDATTHKTVERAHTS